jgi:zinc transport system substrate-binding protein
MDLRWFGKMVSAFSLLSALMLGGAPAQAREGGVIVSVKPVHSLVAGVMNGVGEPGLLVRGGESPHTYSLRPSDARMLDDARIVFWIGGVFETFLAGRWTLWPGTPGS